MQSKTSLSPYLPVGPVALFHVSGFLSDRGKSWLISIDCNGISASVPRPPISMTIPLGAPIGRGLTSWD